MPIDLLIQPPLERLTMSLPRDVETSTFNELLALVDHHHQHGGHPIAVMRRRRGVFLAWHEPAAGPAPPAVTEANKTRGAIVYAAHGDWEDGALKDGAQTLLAQYGD